MKLEVTYREYRNPNDYRRGSGPREKDALRFGLRAVDFVVPEVGGMRETGPVLRDPEIHVQLTGLVKDATAGARLTMSLEEARILLPKLREEVEVWEKDVREKPTPVSTPTETTNPPGSES